MTNDASGVCRRFAARLPTRLRERTVDGRGLADIRLLLVEDGPGRGQRLIALRNAAGIGLEIAVDRGFDISSATWRGINIGWNSANGLPRPPHSVDAEDGVGFYRNLDGFIVTCGLDHIGAAQRESGDRYIHKHRKQTFHPLHGRISSQRATIAGYGIDWSAQLPVIWAEATVKQSAIFGENLVLRRRIELDAFGNRLRLNDLVENGGFRPTPHAILYHINFGYPLLDETMEISGDIDVTIAAEINDEDKGPRSDAVDFFRDVPVIAPKRTATVELRNASLFGGVRARLSYSTEDLPAFGIWSAYQSGTYAFALEPMRRFVPQSVVKAESMILDGGATASYALEIALAPISAVDA